MGKHERHVRAQALSRARDPEGLLVYGAAGVSDKLIKKRFEDLMMFVKKQENLVPFHSGSDNKHGGKGELPFAVEDLYEILPPCHNYCKKLTMDRENSGICPKRRQISILRKERVFSLYNIKSKPSSLNVHN